MVPNFAGKIGIVSGAGSGIGKAVAISLAKAGANVACVDVDASAVLQTTVEINTKINSAGLGGAATGIHADITKLDEVQNAVEAAEGRLEGKLSLAVNCAGITADGFMLNMSEAQWDRVVDVNLKGTFFVTQTVAKSLIAANNPGSIVNISSIIGKVGNIGQANYASSKAGVVAFTKTCAKELARYDIRVNSVLPGFIETPMAQAVPDKIKNKILNDIPMRSFGHTDNIASTCLFLASDEAAYITGAAIEVTGGYHM